MKKLLLVAACFAAFSVTAQINYDAPWLQSLNLESRSTTPTFQELVDAGNTYFETINKDAKGSGYKPFKRWESYWENFVDENGYLPTNQDFYRSWQEIQALNTNRDTQVDDSNWVSLGPTDFANRPTSIANIGRINVIVKDPNNSNTYYAGSPGGGIWKSTDAGANWDVLNDELPQIGVSGIAIDPANSNTIYIATGDDDNSDSFAVGVYKSTDGGASWNETGLNPSNSPTDMNDIYVHPNNSNIIWVATNDGVFKSTNAGTSWSNTLAGNIKDIKIKPGDPDVVYAATTAAFHKSTNGGDSFTQVTTGLPVTSTRLVIDVTPANPDYIYLVSAGSSSSYQGVFRSTNSGNSFTEMANTVDIFESDQAWYDLALAVSDIDEDEIYVGVLNIWKSSNGGDNFTKLNEWFIKNAAYTHADIHYLRFFDGELFAGTDGGFFKSTNRGTTFTDFTEGMQITQFYRNDVSQQTSNKIVGGTQDNGGFGYFNQWNNYHGGDGMEGVIDPNNDNLYYGFMQRGQNLFVSSDSGQSGSTDFAGPEQGNWITPLAVNADSEVFAGYSRLYEFTGSSFTAISPQIQANQNIDRMEIDPSNPDNIYVAVNQNLYKSTNRGVSFNLVESFSSFINWIEVNNNDSNIVYVTTSGFNGDILRSVDGGNNFTDITGSLPSVVKISLAHRDEDPLNTLYLGTHTGVYKYDDNTADWELFDANFPNTSVRDLAINLTDEMIVAATYGRGMWISPLSATQLANDDIRMVGINNPVSNGLECGEISPQITVKNNGQNTINTIDVIYSIDGGSNENFQWNGSLLSEETTIIDLPTLSDLSRGDHNLLVTVNITNDTYPNNNDSGTNFFINDVGVAQLINTFETPGEELITYNQGGGGPLWERGVPTSPDLNTTASGTHVYGTNLNGNYTNNTKAYLLSQCYNLSEITDPILKFHMAFEIELDWDLAYVEYTTDLGATWLLLGSANDPNWYNSDRIAGDGVANDCFNCVGGQWTGNNTTMQQYSYALDDLASEESVIFRIVFHSDEIITGEGVIIDDFFVDGTLSTNEFALNGVKVFPNPSDNIFNIRLDNASDFDMNVTDITGKRVLTQRNISQTTYQLDMTEFASGIYFLNITSSGRKATKKLILK